jgi:replicative DNA helicase
MSFQPSPTIKRALRLERGLLRFSWGIDFLDDALTGVGETDLNLLGAATGVGKTQIATHVALNAAKQGHQVYYFALEAEEGEIENRILFSEIAREWWIRHPHGGGPFAPRYISWLYGDQDEELGPLEEEISPRINSDIATLRTIYKISSFNVEDFVAMFEAIQHDAKLIVIDHLHYFDITHRDENQGLKDAVKKIRNAALEFKKPILLLAHLRKSERGNKNPVPDIDDFYGSSDLVKIGVYVIMVSRAEDKSLGSGNYATWISLPKCRHAGDATNYVGLVGYDLKTGTYGKQYDLYRAKRFCEPERVKSEHRPRWAKRALDTEEEIARRPVWPTYTK